MLRSLRSTRLLADKRSTGNAGYRMPHSWSCCKDGADPPKNPSGSDCTIPQRDVIERCVSTVNGSCINAALSPNCDLFTKRLMRDTRSGCSSAAMTSSAGPSPRFQDRIVIGMVGHIPTISLKGFLLASMQRSWRSRRHGDSDMICRHLRHT